MPSDTCALESGIVAGVQRKRRTLCDHTGPFLSDARVGGRRARAPDGPGKAAPSAWCVVLRRRPRAPAAAVARAGPCARHMFRPSPCFGTPRPHFLLARPPTSADAAAGRDGARGRGVRAGRRISGARRCAAFAPFERSISIVIEPPIPAPDRTWLARWCPAMAHRVACLFPVQGQLLFTISIARFTSPNAD